MPDELSDEIAAFLADAEIKNVVLDTNIYLSFFHFTQDDIASIDRLKNAFSGGSFTLWLPEQVREEYYCNREKKIAEVIKELKGRSLSNNIPLMYRGYDEAKQYLDSIWVADQSLKGLVRNIKDEARSESLRADSVVRDLFGVATAIPRTEALESRARRRVEIGIPPGKDRSLGDAVIWESILQSIPDGESACLISGDKDYFSPLSEDDLLPFLSDEWRRVKKSNLICFRSVDDFVRGLIPQIELLNERLKEELIAELKGSRSFAQTHRVVEKLSRFLGSYTEEQALRLVYAARENMQVYAIRYDNDVKEFYSNVLNNFFILSDGQNDFMTVDDI